MLKIIGLANGEYGLLSQAALHALREADAVVLQTGRIAGAEEIRRDAKEVYTLDAFFEQAADYETLYESGADFVAAMAKDKYVVFGVPGGPGDNGFVSLLRKRMDFDLIPGASDESIAQAVSGKYFDSESIQSIPARRIGSLHPDSAATLIVTQIDNPLLASEVKLFLFDYYENIEIVYISGNRNKLIYLEDLDRQDDYGIGATVALPCLRETARTRYTFSDLLTIMERLRSPDGCPWDNEQTHKSLRQFVLEEAYEVVHAVDTEDTVALADELGDLLLQVVFHAQIGKQCGEFDIGDVITNICTKMIGRHPHIFGDVKVGGSEDVLRNWEAIKREEKGLSTVTETMEDIPAGMSALMRAYKIQKKAAQVGFDWDQAKDALDKLKEEIGEFEAEMDGNRKEAMEDEGGDMLFALVNVLRMLSLNPEVALDRTNGKFIARFGYVEQNAKGELKSLNLEQMNDLWDQAKKAKL